MRDTLWKLPIRCRSILLLKIHYGFKHKEIAEILGCTKNVVKVSLNRARKKFKEVYGDDK